MAEDKQFEATQSRLARAKRDGDLPRSSAITASVSFGCAALGASLVMPFAFAACRGAMIAAANGKGLSLRSFGTLIVAVLAPMFCACLGSITASIIQTGGLVFLLPRLRFEHVNPMKGLKRMLSRDAAVSAAKACVAATVTTAAVLPEVRNTMVADAGLMQYVVSVVRSLRAIVTTSLAVGFIFGVVDFLAENGKWRRRLRMSFEELKRDVKQSEGDPLARNRRKQTRLMFLRGSVSNLRKAAFVISNPTHIAIALEYHPPDVEVPRVLIRAADDGAQIVRRRAIELRIPIIENIPLARVLFGTADIGFSIPRETYVAVAEIVTAIARGST